LDSSAVIARPVYLKDEIGVTIEPVTGQKLYQKARTRIPGGTQLLSKRPEMLLPDQWPAYYASARGAEVWDLDGNRYVDMSYNGIGACVLGYADPDVDAAVHAAVDAGSMCTLNCPEEVELADLLCELHPWAEMVRYARCGGEAMAVAVRIARARSGRDKIAFCGYHGWHDWYLSANLQAGDNLDGHLLPGLAPAGVPRGLAGTALPFHYNRIDELQEIVARHGSELAAVVMEPVRSQLPQPGFLEEVRELATTAGALVVCDEVSVGWRMNTGGAHLRYGLKPDIAVFAKAISNGYPMAAIIGAGDALQAAQDTFISSTYWTERIGPAAALATIRKHRERRVPEHLQAMGNRLQEGWRAAAEKAGFSITVTGLPPLAHFRIDAPDAQALRTLFTQRMLERGFLATNAYYATYAHQDCHIDAYLAAAGETFAELAQAIEANLVRSLLKGPVAHAGFYRLA
jgi:glutamate-1-semialdehyde 2,1-aminomutase